MNQLTNSDRPSFLAPVEDQKKVGAENLSQYQRPSFLKVISRMAGESYSDFNQGDVITVPENELVIPFGETARVVPVFQYEEYTKQAPYGSEEFIIERTNDPFSEVAKRARSSNFEEREDADGSRYVWHINFALYFLDHNESIGNKPVIASFYRGEWKYGANFASLLDARDCNHICGCIFNLTPEKHKNKQYSWEGLTASNPSEGQWVTDEELFNTLCTFHEKFKALSSIEVDYEEGKNDVEEGQFS